MAVVNNLGSFEFDLDGLFGFDSASVSLFGDDILNGGPGNDLLIGGFGNNTLNGWGGNDLLIGGFGNNTLNGGPGNDVLKGGLGDDMLIGGPDQDTFFTSPGNDVILDFSPAIENKTLNFDDLDNLVAVYNGYEGFDWVNGITLSRLWLEDNYPGSGFLNVMNSESNVIVNNVAQIPAIFSDPTSDFDFNSGFFAAGNMNDVTLTVTAFDDDIQVGQATIVLDTQKVFVDLVNMTAEGADSATFTGDFTSIDEIRFQGTGGVDAGIGGLVVAPFIGADDLSITILGDGDLIALPMGTDPAGVIASATSDGAGGTLLNFDNSDTTELLGVPPADIAEAWFI